MDFDVINTILTVVRTNSFSEAAYELSCSQSSVSRRIELAEKELGIKLFTRPQDSIDHCLHLTQVGEQAIPILIRMVEDYGRLHALAGSTAPLTGTLYVGAKGNSMPPMAFSVIKAGFFDRYPGINLDIQFSSLDKLIFLLKSHRLDAVLFSCKYLNPEELSKMESFRLRLLGKVPMSIGMSENNPLASCSSIRMEELQDEVFLLQEETPVKIPGIEKASMYDFIDRIQHQYGFTPKRMVIKETMLEIRYQFVVSGKGVFPSYTPAVWRRMPGVTYVPLAKEDESYVQYYLLSRANEHEQELRAFADYIASCISSRDPVPFST